MDNIIQIKRNEVIEPDYTSAQNKANSIDIKDGEFISIKYYDNTFIRTLLIIGTVDGKFNIINNGQPDWHNF